MGEQMTERINELKDIIKSIPTLPGIYKMLDSRGNIIYVGKSKCLKKRVSSYFTKDHSWEKINRMVSLIYDIEYIVTDTHLEARLLECKLIKTLQPPFNSQLKNDQRYVYLQIKDYNSYHALVVINERGENSYGPFRSQYMLIELIGLLKNLYPIIWNGKQYVFEHHLFPNNMNKDIFECNQNALIELFSDETKLALFISQLEVKMMEAAKIYNYETASFYRDLIQRLEYVKRGLNGYKELFYKRLILKIPTIDGFKLFYVNKGHILLTKKYKRISQLNKYMDLFIKKSHDIKTNVKATRLDDKTVLDYHDILYSEINSFKNDSDGEIIYEF